MYKLALQRYLAIVFVGSSLLFLTSFALPAEAALITDEQVEEQKDEVEIQIRATLGEYVILLQMILIQNLEDRLDALQ